MSAPAGDLLRERPLNWPWHFQVPVQIEFIILKSPSPWTKKQQPICKSSTSRKVQKVEENERFILLTERPGNLNLNLERVIIMCTAAFDIDLEAVRVGFVVLCR